MIPYKISRVKVVSLLVILLVLSATVAACCPGQ